MLSGYLILAFFQESQHHQNRYHNYPTIIVIAKVKELKKKDV